MSAVITWPYAKQKELMAITSRRTVLAMLGGLIAAPLARGFSLLSNEKLEIELSVMDEQGKPIPYVTIWGYLLPRSNLLAIDGDDLWRVTTRYQSSFEFATPFHRIVPALEVFTMGDAGGVAKPSIDYSRMEGLNSRRPASMRVGFSVMKRGYLPARIEFQGKDETQLSGKIVLKRDPNRPVETQPYLEEFERIRYELSDASRNADISRGTYERDETLRKGLEAVAGNALDAGDKATAARVYARMQHLPTVKMYQERAIGFAQSDPYSELSWGYLTKAYQLDPSHPYIAAEFVFGAGADEFGGKRFLPEQASEERRRAFAAFLAKLDALMLASGTQIWPNYHRLFARWHRKSNEAEERAKVVPLLEALYRFEPKFETKDELLRTAQL